MVYIIISLLFFFSIASFFIYVLYQFFKNFRPSTNKVVADLKAMKQEVQASVSTLVPWTKEEMELLSFTQRNQTIKKGLSKSAKGIFTSIYQEPLLAYNYRQYISTGINALLYARTSLHEFAYRIKRKEIIVSIDNEYAGVLKEDGSFYGGKGNKLLLAKIDQDDSLKLHPITIGGKEVGKLVNPNKAELPNPRAFKLVAPMEAEDEKVFLSLAILEIVTESLDR